MNRSLRRLVLAALFLAIALLLPLLTGQLHTFGNALCPMHLPVLLCGFICGPWYGLAVGLVAPLLRFVCFGAPTLFPRGVAMSLELAAYGGFAGLFYRLFPRRTPFLYLSLLLAMLTGRLVWGAARTAFSFASPAAAPFSAAVFFADGFASALPGILLQLAVIPPLVKVGTRKASV